MNSVSGRTSFLVCNDPDLATGKVSAAGDFATVCPTGDTDRGAAGHPGHGRGCTGWSTKGCRVLVLGGPHEVSARVRDEVMAHGGRVAVNLTPLRSRRRTARILRRGEVTDPPDEVTSWDLFVSWTLADPPARARRRRLRHRRGGEGSLRRAFRVLQRRGDRWP